MSFLSEVQRTSKIVRQQKLEDQKDFGLLRYKRRIRKYALQGKTKVFIPLMLPTTRDNGEAVAKLLKKEGLRMERTDSGIYMHWDW